ncbi:MAG: hypothetical protein OIF40_11870 [Mangrovicoccus sp.]|nr:hypothetical protein [Mangrovicoccus sp.]
MQAAVLTGDLVKSTRASPEAVHVAFASLQSAAEICAIWHGASLRFTRFRGDGWQVVLARPELALRSALYLLATLRASDCGLETRLSLGLGEAKMGSAEDLSSAEGSAFQRAGHMLDNMPRNRRLIMAADGAPALGPGLCALLDAVQQNWGREQAQALLYVLPPAPKTQMQIAEHIGIRQQSVADRLQAARFWAVEAALTDFETTLTTFLSDTKKQAS